jgi:hypothetical protein
VKAVRTLLAVGMLTPVLGCSLFPFEMSGQVRIYVTNTDDADYSLQIAELTKAWAVGANEGGEFDADVGGRVLFLVFDAECTVIGRYGIGPGSYQVTIRVEERPVADLQQASGPMLGGPLLMGAPVCPNS